MKQDLSDKRKVYSKDFIDFQNLKLNPYELFKSWYDNAVETSKIEEPNAMSLATIGQDNFPRTRIVLLKEYNLDGFVFYTNYKSEKGNSIENSDKVCLSFFWPVHEQQIIIKGNATKVSAEVSDQYFQKRPFESQIGAVVSAQSSVIDLNSDLDKRANELIKEHQGEIVPRPENWGGYLVSPVEFEFWQGRPSRLHDRLRYRLENDKWMIERLAP